MFGWNKQAIITALLFAGFAIGTSDSFAQNFLPLDTDTLPTQLILNSTGITDGTQIIGLACVEPQPILSAPTCDTIRFVHTEEGHPELRWWGEAFSRLDANAFLEDSDIDKLSHQFKVDLSVLMRPSDSLGITYRDSVYIRNFSQQRISQKKFNKLKTLLLLFAENRHAQMKTEKKILSCEPNISITENPVSETECIDKMKGTGCLNERDAKTLCSLARSKATPDFFRQCLTRTFNDTIESNHFLMSMDEITTACTNASNFEAAGCMNYLQKIRPDFSRDWVVNACFNGGAQKSYLDRLFQYSKQHLELNAKQVYYRVRPHTVLEHINESIANGTTIAFYPQTHQSSDQPPLSPKRINEFEKRYGMAWTMIDFRWKDELPHGFYAGRIKPGSEKSEFPTLDLLPVKADANIEKYRILYDYGYNSITFFNGALSTYDWFDFVEISKPIFLIKDLDKATLFEVKPW